MAFGIQVYRVLDRDFVNNFPPNSSEWDQWEEECDRRRLFEAPLAADGDAFSHWSSPASELGLPLLAGIYDRGLEVAGEDLDSLLDEVSSLERYWLETVDEKEARTTSIYGHEFSTRLLALLFERAEWLRAAIRVAQRVDGFVSIG